MPLIGASKIGIPFRGGGGLTPLALELTYDDIANATSRTLSEWNTLFNLPTNGTLFTSVETSGNTIKLFGSGDMATADTALYSETDINQHLISFIDNAHRIRVITRDTLFTHGAGAWVNALGTLILPVCTSISSYALSVVDTLTHIELPSCTSFGPTVGDDGVFWGIAGKTISLTIPAALMTCNSGSPDGDIAYLQANNTVTIVQV